MKIPKPGQFFKFNGFRYQTRKRTNGCKGCVLDDIILCPNIVDSRNGTPPLECELWDIILTIPKSS